MPANPRCCGQFFQQPGTGLAPGEIAGLIVGNGLTQCFLEGVGIDTGLGGDVRQGPALAGSGDDGDAMALGFLDGSRYLPVIRVRRGQKLRIRFNKRLLEYSIVHWHGLHIVQRMDGHPMYAIGAGKTFVYEFVVDNRAGTYWFHPHPHGRTGALMRGQFMLNGRTSGDDMMEVSGDEKVRLGTTEVWAFVNQRSGMSMVHPMHIHNLQFRVIGRSGPGGGLQQDLIAGATDEGLKDVGMVMPGERVRELMTFDSHTGLYLDHCHILEHEDLGMMRNYLVQA